MTRALDRAGAEPCGDEQGMTSPGVHRSPGHIAARIQCCGAADKMRLNVKNGSARGLPRARYPLVSPPRPTEFIRI